MICRENNHLPYSQVTKKKLNKQNQIECTVEYTPKTFDTDFKPQKIHITSNAADSLFITSVRIKSLSSFLRNSLEIFIATMWTNNTAEATYNI